MICVDNKQEVKNEQTEKLSMCMWIYILIWQKETERHSIVPDSLKCL